MDADKLARLRARYGQAKGGDIHDPAFKAVADTQFRDGERRRWPFADVATFLGAPYRPQALEEGFSGLDVAIFGVPMDLGVTNRSGTRFGPRAVRGIERIGPYEHVLRALPTYTLRVADVGDVAMESRFSLERCHADIEAYARRVVEAGVRTLAVGGDHSISLPILKAVGAGRPVGMIHIDAHADTSGPYEDTKFHHGGPFRQAVLDGVLDPERTIQIGIRGSADWLWEFSTESGMTMIHAEEVDTLGIPAIVERIHEVVGEGPTYLSFDIDSIDPAFAPGTGTPEVGGLTPREVLALMRGCAGLDIVGGDVVEVAPQYDATTNTAHVAGQMLLEILSLMSLAPSLRD
ncbi:agmatinase [Salinarimonas ramus]|uniref:Agmatinase n=1 Tax=Salinarimonas ramus TaxID=690164 RepID=A0A917V6A1_9HYPH|nr:agmatinase [Salinarimonas ramus]GGK43763.1 agmatinase [Salinarimonas ramus]